MSRVSPYSDDQRAAIVQAAKNAQRKGNWQDGLKAAKEEGYKGGLGYLMKLVSPGKRRGRPQGSLNAKKSPVVAPAVNGNSMDQIERIVAAEVSHRLNAARQSAIAALNEALSYAQTVEILERLPKNKDGESHRSPAILS